MSVFYRWAPKWLVMPLLILALFPHLMLMTLFSSNATFSASFLGVEADDIQFLFSLMYATIVVALLIMTRFFMFFNTKSYLLLMTSINIIILFAMTVTKTYEVLVTLRFLQGAFSVFEGAILLPVILSLMKSAHAKKIAYSILYGIMMCGATFTASLMKIAIENYDHNQMIYFVIYFHILVLFFIMAFFNTQRLFPKKPLYQLDISSCIILFISLITGAYAIVYGRKLDWFNSTSIQLSTICSLIFGALFVLKQQTTKRPLFHFTVFKSEHVILGILLFFVYYIIRAAMNLVYNTMRTTWKWPWENVIDSQYYNVYGSVLGISIALICLIRNYSYKLIFIASFLLLSASCFWFSKLFYPDTNTFTIQAAIAFQGLGQGLLFTPLIMYIISSVHPSIVSNAAMAGTAIRFWTTTIGFALMQNASWILGQKHQEILGSHFQATDTFFSDVWNKRFALNLGNHLSQDAEQLTAISFQNQINSQAMLLSNSEIFMALFWFGIFTTVAIIFYDPIKKIYTDLFISKQIEG